MRVHAIQIASVLLIFATCSRNVSGRSVPAEADGTRGHEFAVETAPDPAREPAKPDDESKEAVPILPPIILLDFGGDAEETGNATAEEKSKRTVNNGLAYGLDRDALRPRKYNYYLPAGKSGTTVSIEESISPFLPKTIIETVPATNSASGFANGDAATKRKQTQNQSVFGLRTKKPGTIGTAGSFQSYQSPLTTTESPLASYARFGNDAATASTRSPLAFGASQPARHATPGPAKFAYTTAAPSLLQNIRSDVDQPHNFGRVAESVESSTVRPSSYDAAQLGNAGSRFQNLPRYTVENGVRYENKIFWKYPDGRVSDVPPPTYVETYAEYPETTPERSAAYQSPHSIYESSVLSQGPVRFPTVSEPVGREPTPFVSSDTLSSSVPQQQVYRLGYQNLVRQRPNVNLARPAKPNSNVAGSYSFSTFSPPATSSAGGSTPRPSAPIHGYRTTTSRYTVNSPDPEYTDATEPAVNKTALASRPPASSQKQSSRFASRFPPNVQQYLDGILSRDDESRTESSDDYLTRYSNLRYADLLNYNPSISEYVRNPASILNVRPTFVQAGNSLIPVVILRVDGASPVRQQPSQNVNLKALLQQYLVQYANSIRQLAQPSGYDLRSTSVSRGSNGEPSDNPIFDLLRATQGDGRTPGTASRVADSYTGKSSYETSNVDDPTNFVGPRYTGTLSGRPRTKSVQILEDPRFANYNADN